MLKWVRHFIKLIIARNLEWEQVHFFIISHSYLCFFHLLFLGSAASQSKLQPPLLQTKLEPRAFEFKWPKQEDRIAAGALGWQYVLLRKDL